MGRKDSKRKDSFGPTAALIVLLLVVIIVLIYFFCRYGFKIHPTYVTWYIYLLLISAAVLTTVIVVRD